MFPPEFKPSSRSTSAATRQKAPRKSTRLIFAVSVSLIGTLIVMIPRMPPTTMKGIWMRKAYLQPSLSLITVEMSAPESTSPKNELQLTPSINTPQPHPRPKYNIPHPLPNSSFPKRDQIRGYKDTDGVETSATGTRHNTPEDHHPVVLGQTAEESPNREEGDSEDETCPASVYVCQFARERLTGSIG